MAGRLGRNSLGSALLMAGGGLAVAAVAAWPQQRADTASSSPAVNAVTDDHGAIRSIRGIEGIDSVMLENLEVVLRMQERPQESKGKGSARTAARLMAREVTDPLEDVPDAREEHLEFELEGS